MLFFRRYDTGTIRYSYVVDKLYYLLKKLQNRCFRQPKSSAKFFVIVQVNYATTLLKSTYFSVISLINKFYKRQQIQLVRHFLRFKSNLGKLSGRFGHLTLSNT